MLLLAFHLVSGATSPQPTCSEEEWSRENEDICAENRALKVYGRTHGEVSFGYLGQWSNESNRALELKPSQAGDPPFAGSITEPFLGNPFSGTLLSGATLESRVVYDGIRITAGLRFPFMNYRPSDTAQVVNVGGVPREVLVRSVSLWDVRTGIGFEFATRRVTPYFDVLGDFQNISTQLVVDGQPAKYQGTAFSLGGRLGMRIQMQHAFIALSAEATALGPLRVGGSAQLGFAF
ncbi:MAG: hypothetical protein QM817_30990 [Archangium sp.]